MRIVQEHYDYGTNTYYINEVEDVEPLLDHNKELRNHLDLNAYKKNAARWRKIWDIPNIISEKILREYGLNTLNKYHWPEVEKVLKRDFPYLKTVDRI